MKKTLTLLFLTILMTPVLWAEGKQEGSSKSAEIKLMTSSAKFKEAYREIAAQMEDREGLKTDIQVIPDDQYQNLVQIKLTSREVPDIIMQNAPEQYQAMKADKTCLDLSDQPWTKRMINPAMVTDASGKVWAMPQESGSFFGACYYNAELLSSLGIENPAPVDFEEFVDLLKKIRDADPTITPLYMNHRDNWTTQIFMTCGYSIALKEQAPETYNAIMAHKIGFSDVPEFKQVLGQFKRLIDEGLVNEDHLSAGYDDGLAAVASGKAAMVYNGEWAISSLESEGKTIGCFPIPWNDNAYLSTGAYVQGFFVPRDAGNSEGALRFLDLYSSPEYMDIYYAENPGFPAFDGVNGGKVNPQLSAMVNDYMSREKTVYQMNDYMAPLVPLWGELWGAYVEFAAGNMESSEVLGFWDETVANHMSTIGQPGW